MSKTDRRQFLQLLGLGAAATGLNATIARALAIPASIRTGTIKDVEHIVILMQENNSFDEYFGTLRGVRGFSDPRVVQLPSGNAAWFQPKMDLTSPYNTPDNPSNYVYFELGYPAGVPANQVGGTTADLVVPPFRINVNAPGVVPTASGIEQVPAIVATPADTTGAALTNLGLTYRADLDHGWVQTHAAWNGGVWDEWVNQKTPLTMAYLTRDDIPYHYALADAFTVGDNYYCSVMSSTNPNRYYQWTGCIGNVAPFVQPDGTVNGSGTDGAGRGPTTGNGLSGTNYLLWETFPEVLQQAGISWKIYQDLAGTTFAGDFGGGGPTGFAGNFQDNPVLYFSQYAGASTSSPLFHNGVAAGSTNITGSNSAIPASETLPAATAGTAAWQQWATGLFDVFRRDVQNGTLPQVSWVVAPAGYSEHPSYPSNYGAWYIAQILDILVSNPEVFSRTAFIINYDENDGFFDHLVPPTPPQASDGSDGVSTVSTAYEIVTTTAPAGPIGLGVRVPLLVISPWSKGGYVNSEVFDHSSTIRFIEKRFDLPPFANISPWRRAVAGDLTSCFNFATPNGAAVNLPDASGYLPSVGELSGQNSSVPPFIPGSLSTATLGVPAQEQGIRPARALPYELDVVATVQGGSVILRFINTGHKTVVVHVRSAAGDPVRHYTVQPGKLVAGTWNVTGGTYNLAVHGPNGFARYFQGSVAAGSAALVAHARYGRVGAGSLSLSIFKPAGAKSTVQVLDAYTGAVVPVVFQGPGALPFPDGVPAPFAGPGESFVRDWALDRFHGWYDLVVTVAEDPGFRQRLAGHVETGQDSWSDPAMGALVKLHA